MSDFSDSPERLAPSSPEAEEGVLGSVLINPDAILEVSEFLKADDFYVVRNSWVWMAILAIHDRGEAVDNLTVIEELRNRDQLESIGGPAYITYLINNTPTHIHAETYARIVERTGVRRRLLNAAQRIGQVAMEESSEIDAVIDAAEAQLFAVTERRTVGAVDGVSVVGDALDQYAMWIAEPAEVRGLRSGIPRLDQFIGGFSPGRPYTFYGDTGMGKSTLLAWITVNLMEQAPGLIISTEMTSTFWIMRAVSDMSGVPYTKIKSGQLTDAERAKVDAIYERLKRLSKNFTMLKASGPTPNDIKANVRRLMRDGRCEWIIIDSVNNITLPGVTDIYPRTSAAADCSMYLGVDMGCTVLQTAQIGRNNKVRKDSLMPRLHDGEGSGKIEQNSRMVIGVYRHQYYVDRNEAKANDIFLEDNVILTVLKNDTGMSGKWLPLRYTPGESYRYDEYFEARKKKEPLDLPRSKGGTAVASPDPRLSDGDEDERIPF